MPRSAMEYVKPDHVARLAEIGPLLGRLAGAKVDRGKQASSLLEEEAQIELESPLHAHGPAGAPSPFSCPACGGS